MSRPVYSVQLGKLNGPGIGVTPLVLPDDINTLVVRDMVATQPVSSPDIPQPNAGFEVVSTFGGLVWTMSPPWSVGGRSYVWPGDRLVLQLGEGLDFNAFDSNWSIFVSGYRLTPS